MGVPQSWISTLGSLVSVLADIVAAVSGDLKMVPKPGAVQQAFGVGVQADTTARTTTTTVQTCNEVASQSGLSKVEVLKESPHPETRATVEDIYSNPDVYLNVPELIHKNGFPIESHEVLTEDGYILTLFRISHGRKGQRLCSRPPVLLMHGLLNSSAAWITHHPDKALAYALADQGHDVWLGNSRGSTYSRKHEILSTADRAFWEFSFHEMGKYDIPAIISHVLTTTGHSSLFYIGHSLGNAMLMIAASCNPKLIEKVKLFIAFAPAVYLHMTEAKMISVPAAFSQKQKTVLDFLTGTGEFMSKTFIQSTKTMLPFVSRPEYLACKGIIASMITVGGYNPDQIYWPQFPVLAGHTPSSTSVKTYIHCIQYFNSEVFRQYDHGSPEMNEKVYGQPTPATYDLSKVTCPVTIFWGQNDMVCRPEGIKRLASELPNVIGCRKVPCEQFTHTDFLYAKDADKLVYNDVIELISSCK